MLVLTSLSRERSCVLFSYGAFAYLGLWRCLKDADSDHHR